MFFTLIQLELKGFFRKPQFVAGLAMKIGMMFLLGYMAFIFIGGAFGLYFGAKEEHLDPVQLFCKFFLFYWVIDLALKYFIQQLPAENIKPLLGLKITKNQIVGYTLTKIMLSFFSWAFILFIIPFGILLLLDPKYSAISVVGLLSSVTFLLLINSFLNIIINKNSKLLMICIGIVLVLAGLQYFKMIDLLQFSEQVFYHIYQNPVWALVPILLFLLMFNITFKFIKTSLYLDKGLEMKTTVGKTENIAFLNKYGATGAFINNDIRLIKRSKAARAAVFGSIMFLFYGLLYFNKGYHNSFMQVFLGIFVTGGFNFMYGQRVPAWDSSYYPLMMTQRVPYKNYLKAKWSLFVIVTLFSMLISIGYAYISWEFYFTVFAAGLYNLGVNSYLTLFAGAYNKQAIDLNVASKGFTSSQNNMNLKLMLMLIPQMLLPMGVFALVKYFFGMMPAVGSLAILGFIGFLLRNKIFDVIVKVYKTEKYNTIAAFNKK